MSELSEPPADFSGEPHRCPQCDSVVAADADQCLMCGAALPDNGDTAVTATPDTAVEATAPSTPDPIPEIFESVMRQRETRLTAWLTAVFAVIIIVLGTLVLRFQGGEVIVALVPTPSPIPPTFTYTPTWTPLPTGVLNPTDLPVETAVSIPTSTPNPPRSHTVTSGETLIGLALRYRVSPDSIAVLNSMAADASLLVNQRLSIPWPTATPPLVPVATLINGETVIADPTNCEIYEVKGGDSLSAIAVRYDVDFGLFLQVNRLKVESILQPGDTVCIPEIVYGGSLPPTPGPTPTPTTTSAPKGPQLLYPVAKATIEPADGIITLQWAAVKTLADDEWYMVELSDINAVDDLPRRGFTRDNAFQVPASWRPPVEETHQMLWRVSIVKVTDRRADGLPIYTFGGESSRDAVFFWPGAVPTSTPQPTPTSTPEP